MTKATFLSIAILFAFFASSAQPAGYIEWIKKANALYETKDYKGSADAYTKAFATNGGLGSVEDRYNAACSWSLAGNKDSAFFHLNRLATKAKYTNYRQLAADSDLENLHADKRWKSLLAEVQQNKEKAEANLNKPLVAILDTVFQNDQGNRQKIDEVAKKYGYDSKEIHTLWAAINYNDSLDLIKVKRILDQYGWLGPDVVGDEGNATLFLVIQHADQKTQEKYLPMMREAVKNKKARPSDLALLEDRVALGQGKLQIYGSQVSQDAKGNAWLRPLADPDNVDKRRAEVGLEPLRDYLSFYNLKWDIAEYKRQLPELLKKEKGQ